METLADRIDREGPLNELDAVGWAIRLAKALEELHARGEVHGNVSPACVASSAPSRDAPAKLLVGGSARRDPSYHAPDRAGGAGPSRADDVWALGATLQALLTGSSPFQAATEEEIYRKILTGSPAPLAVYDVGDDDLQRVLDGAMARDVAERFTSAEAFRAALEAWHPDIGARELPPLERDDAIARASRLSLDLEGFDLPGQSPPTQAARTGRRADGYPSHDIDQEAATVMREVPEELRRLAAERMMRLSSHPPAPPPPTSAAAGATPGSLEDEPTVEGAPLEAVAAAASSGAGAFPQYDDDDDEGQTLLRPFPRMGSGGGASANHPEPPPRSEVPRSKPPLAPQQAATRRSSARPPIALGPLGPIFSAPRPAGPVRSPSGTQPAVRAPGAARSGVTGSAGQTPLAAVSPLPSFDLAPSAPLAPGFPPPAGQPPPPFGAPPAATPLPGPAQVPAAAPLSAAHVGSGIGERVGPRSQLDSGSFGRIARGPGRLVAIAVSLALLVLVAAVTFYVLTKQLGG